MNEKKEKIVKSDQIVKEERSAFENFIYNFLNEDLKDLKKLYFI